MNCTSNCNLVLPDKKVIILSDKTFMGSECESLATEEATCTSTCSCVLCLLRTARVGVNFL